MRAGTPAQFLDAVLRLRRTVCLKFRRHADFGLSPLRSTTNIVVGEDSLLRGNLFLVHYCAQVHF